MKRLVTYLIVFTVSMATYAQAPTSAGKQAHLQPKKTFDVVDLQQPAFYKNNPVNMTPDMFQTKSGRGSVSYIPIGRSFNLYSILLDDQNQVAFHPDINAVTFIHRQNDGTTGGSGGLSYDLSTDGGATWTTNAVVTPDYNAGLYAGVITGSRYPSATIYNPSGNTDPNSAYIVGNGPALTAASGSWGAQFRVSSTLDSSNISEVYYSDIDYPHDFHPYATNYYSNGKLWSISTSYNNTAATPDPAYDTISYRRFYINQIDYNAGTNSFDYTTTVLLPDWHEYIETNTASASFGYTQNYAGYSWQIAFDPTGDIGYIILVGALEGASPMTPKPTLWKTTDAGATWNLLPDFNFGSLTEFQDWTIPTWDGQYNPWCIGNDAVVDMDGRLHLFGEWVSRSTTNETDDSIGYSWGGYEAFMHCTTTDGTDWTAKHIGESFLEDAVYGAVGIPYRLQASVTPDGSKVFMTYTMSDSTIVTDHSLPQLIALGYDVTSQEYTNQVDISSGTDYDGAMYYPTLAPYSMDLGGLYELPVVFALPNADDVTPPQYYYVKGIQFDDDDFGAEPAADASYTYSVNACVYNFANTSANSTSYSWDFGDGSAVSPLENPSHTFTANGSYSVCLTASNASSSDVACQTINVTCVVGINDIALDNALTVYPTPSAGYVTVSISDNSISDAIITVTNMLGEVMVSPVSVVNNIATLNLSSLANGNYMVKVQTEDGVAVRQITIAK